MVSFDTLVTLIHIKIIALHILKLHHCDDIFVQLFTNCIYLHIYMSRIYTLALRGSTYNDYLIKLLNTQRKSNILSKNMYLPPK